MKLVAGGRVSCGQIKIFGVLNSFDMTRKWRNVSALVSYSLVPPLAIGVSIGYLSLLSPSQMRKARPHCFRLLTQLMRCAFCLALASAGSSRAARMASTATMTSRATRVKPDWLKRREVEFMFQL